MNDIYYNKSFDDQQTSDSYSWGGNAVYTNSKIRVTNYFSKVSENYNPEVGFVPRKDFMFLSPSAKYIFYPNKSSVNSHGPEIDYEMYLLDSVFKFNNPNVTEACGCGESIKFAGM